MASRIAVALLFLFGLSANAATFNISAGASQSTISSTIATAAAAGGGNTVQFAAGSYSTSSSIPIPCPASALIITGPNTGWWAHGVVGSWNLYPTAVITSSNAGSSGHAFNLSGSCSTAITIEYLEWNGNHPFTGGGFINLPGNDSNVTITHNYIHGANEWTPFLQNCTPAPAQQACSNGVDNVDDDPNASQIYLDGGTSSTDTNLTITYNVVGAAANPGTNDCGSSGATNVTTQGMMLWTNTIWDFHSNLNPQYQQNDYYGNGFGGHCNFMWQDSGITNGNITNNVIQNLEEGIKGQESADQLVGVNYNYNDFSYIHHSFMETQMEANNISLPSNFQYNDLHDPYSPQSANWMNSTAQNQFSNLTDNLVIGNQGGPGQHNLMPPHFETWGNGQIVHNIFQGQDAGGGGVTFYMVNTNDNPSLPSAVSYNTFQFNDGQGFNDWVSFTPTGQGTTFGLQSEGENGQTNSNAPAIAGNSWTTAYAAQQSTAPTLSPNGGSFSGSQVVTITNLGNTSSTNPLPRGNTGTWCTLDGSTPSPRGSTSAYYATGDTFTLSSTTTVRCVGMWGAINQPASYTSLADSGGTYGYTPSGVVSAVFTNSGGGTPQAVAPVFNPGTSTIPSTGAAITLSTSTAGAIIYYCVGSCTPTSGSTPYTGAITVTSTSTYNAITIASGFTNSAISTATYTVSGPSQAATPVPSTTSQTFTAPFNLTFTDATSGALIYYCMIVGCVPTSTSTLYTGAIPVSGPTAITTVNAIAIAPGFTNSLISQNTYTYLLFIGQNQITTDVQTYTPGMILTYAVTGTNPAGYTVQSCTINQASGPEGVTNGALTDCLIILAPTPTTEASTPVCHATYTNTSATGTIATLNMASSGCGTLPASTAYWIGVATNDTKNPSSYGGWSPVGGTTLTPVPTATTNTGTYPGAFEGTVPYGTYTGFPSSLTVNAGTSQFSQYVTLTALAPTMVATPVILPVSGTYSGSQTVSITDSTGGSSSYYCLTMGCTPTNTSTLYTGPFSVTPQAFVSAIATATGFQNSAVASNTYNPPSSIATVSVCTGAPGSTPTPCSVMPPCPNCVLAGGTQQLYVKIVYTDATVTYNTTVGAPDTKGTSITSWVSSNTSIGTISSAGLFTGGVCPTGQTGCITTITGAVTGGDTFLWDESLAAAILGPGLLGGNLQ